MAGLGRLALGSQRAIEPGLTQLMQSSRAGQRHGQEKAIGDGSTGEAHQAGIATSGLS